MKSQHIAVINLRNEMPTLLVTADNKVALTWVGTETPLGPLSKPHWPRYRGYAFCTKRRYVNIRMS